MPDVRPDMTAQHIALVFHDFSTGGTERIAIRLANCWAAGGRRVTIFCGTEEGRARSLVCPEVTVIACTPQIRRGWTSRFRLGWRLATLLDVHKPDIVFSPGNFHLSVIAVAGRRMRSLSTRFVCKISNPLLPRNAPSLVQRLLSRMLRPLVASVDQWTAMSPRLASEATIILGAKPIQYIPEPILDQMPTPPSHYIARDQHPVVLCAGRLEWQKDFQLALQAFAELSPLLGARLVILGEGPDKERLEAESRRLDIENFVTFAGYVDNVAEWMARASLFLMTSRFEGFPAVLIEARSMGLPIVTTDCSAAISEIISRDCHGQIVRSRAPEVIGAAINRQLSVPQTNGVEIALGTDEFQLSKIAPQWLQLFDRIAA